MEGILYILIAFLLMALIGSIDHEKRVIKRKNSIIKDLTDQIDDLRDQIDDEREEVDRLVVALNVREEENLYWEEKYRKLKEKEE